MHNQHASTLFFPLFFFSLSFSFALVLDWATSSSRLQGPICDLSLVALERYRLPPSAIEIFTCPGRVATISIHLTGIIVSHLVGTLVASCPHLVC